MNGAADLGGSFVDPATQKTVNYEVTNVPLGIGRKLVRRDSEWPSRYWRRNHQGSGYEPDDEVPLKAAIATSNFTIGVTASTAAIIYWTLGFVKPEVAAPSAIGVLIGPGWERRSRVGSIRGG